MVIVPQLPRGEEGTSTIKNYQAFILTSPLVYLSSFLPFRSPTQYRGVKVLTLLSLPFHVPYALTAMLQDVQ